MRPMHADTYSGQRGPVSNAQFMRICKLNAPRVGQLDGGNSRLKVPFAGLLSRNLVEAAFTMALRKSICRCIFPGTL